MTPPPAIAISGGSRGIGRAIAEVFGQQGYTVFVSSRTSGHLQAMQEAWPANYPTSTLHTFCADLATEAGCLAWAGHIGSRVSSLQVLVHNLGQFAPGDLLTGPPPQLAHFFATNVFSAHYLTQALLDLLRGGQPGHLVTIGSVATTDWPAPLHAYALSKYALEAWHRGVRRELAGTAVKTTLVRPGATLTSSWDGIAVDPATLLTPDRVAQVVAQVVAATADFEEITVRPLVAGSDKH
jgi:NAD(P)-dependent dehydrogenase (short-subunit alcohol dehydrogenase family)